MKAENLKDYHPTGLTTEDFNDYKMVSCKLPLSEQAMIWQAGSDAFINNVRSVECGMIDAYLVRYPNKVDSSDDEEEGKQDDDEEEGKQDYDEEAKQDEERKSSRRSQKPKANKFTR